MLGMIVFGHLAFGEDHDNISAKVALFFTSVVAVIAVSLILGMYVFKGSVPKKRDMIDLAIGLLSIGFLAYLPAFLIAQIYFPFNKLSTFPISSLTIVTIFAGALVLIIGIAFFALRLKRRFIYGFLEVISGMCIAAHKVYSEGSLNLNLIVSEPVFIGVLTGGIYLVVRGLDNMYQGLNTDPWGQRVLKWISSVTETPVDDV